MRYRRTTEPIRDINDVQLSYGDICEFIIDGKVFQGQIEDIGNDYSVEWGVRCSSQEHPFGICYPLDFLKDIKVIKPSESCGEGLTRVIKIEDLLEIELKRQGFLCEQHYHGMLVNGKFIIASAQKKWRVLGKSVWYRYKDTDALIRYLRS